jgi:tetratricopeptide (TPR) repeat protein
MRPSAETLTELSELGQFYLLNRRYRDAIKVIRRALALQSSTELFIKLGLAYEGMNQVDEAVAAFRQALEFDPKNEEADKHLSRLVENRKG